jgi:hypothetical protein
LTLRFAVVFTGTGGLPAGCGWAMVAGLRVDDLRTVSTCLRERARKFPSAPRIMAGIFLRASTRRSPTSV